MAPGNDTEQKLAKIWSDVLGIEKVSTRDNFFALGGDSILAIQIVARAQSVGLKMTPAQFFESLTIQKLATVVEDQTQLNSVAAEKPKLDESASKPEISMTGLKKGAIKDLAAILAKGNGGA